MFNPLAESTVLELACSGSVCEFGNQRYGGVADYPSVKSFYLDNGYDDYLALDVNTEKNAIICDLNYPASVDRQFDLVTNNGTGEHLWNQHQVFKNVHDLCKVGGTMLHILPLTPWINHGFFNYNPILFRDLAYANNYAIRIQRIGNRKGVVKDLGPWGFLEKRPTTLMEEISRIGGEVFNIFAFRKISYAAFKMPMQGKYQQDIASDDLKSRYTA